MKTDKRISRLFIVGLFVITGLQACKKDEDEVETPPADQNEEEVITTMRIQFTDSAGILPEYSATFRDPDGPGGVGPDIFDTIRLNTNSTYLASIILLNETESPADTISNEVLEEDDEHLFCFTITGANAEVEITDSDGIYGVGLESKWRTGDMSIGDALVELKHQPGIKDGTCDPGETDIQVNFVIDIE